MSGSVDLEEFRAGYLAEVDEHLRAIQRHLLAAEEAARAGRPEPRAVRELFRSMHTIKGLSAMVALEPIVDLTHALEALLRAADQAGGRLPAPAFALLHGGIEALEARIRAVTERRAVAPAPTALIAELAAVESEADRGPGAAHAAFALPEELSAKLAEHERVELLQGIAQGRRAVSVDFVPTPDRQAAGVNVTSVRERMAELGTLVKVIPQHRPASADTPGGLSFTLILLSDADDAAIAGAATTTADQVVELAAPLAAVPDADDAGAVGGAGPPGVVRVDIRRLDEALDHLAALVVVRHRLHRAIGALRARGVEVRELEAVAVDTGRHLRDLRASVMRARMVPVRDLLDRIPLVVRGMTRGTTKDLDVQIEAGSSELDKAVAERLLGPIVHLVRNAVDHGIESTETRAATGKPARASLRVTAHDRGDNTLELEICDDGAGIDAQAVARRAGRPTPADARELLDLLATPGFSTRDQADTTSGRGMGVDIVRRVVVGELGGDLDLRTEPGRGTTFILRVPVSVSIIDAFTFACGDQSFAVPVSLVEEILEVDPAVVHRPPSPRNAATEGVELIDRRGEAVPLVDLDRLFRIAPEPHARRKAIVVRRAGTPYAFAVDRMLGQQEIVLRPLEDPLVRVAGVAGSTDLGDGRPALVLDLPALAPGDRAGASR